MPTPQQLWYACPQTLLFASGPPVEKPQHSPLAVPMLAACVVALDSPIDKVKV
jgi:hypothetical protein